MIKLIFADDAQTMMYPNGEIATKERMEADFPAITAFKHVIETDENNQVCFAVQNFAAMRSSYNIDERLSDNEALQMIQDILNAPEPAPEPTDQTRIADALEDLVVLNMPDEEV